MQKHISYFVLKKNHKSFKKGSKTKIRKRFGDFFELTKKDGSQIKFREDKWNKELFEPVYFKDNINTVKNNLITEYNELIETSFEKQIEKFGLNVYINLVWNWENYYDIGEINVELNKNIYKSQLDKKIGNILAEALEQDVPFFESFAKKEITKENDKINIFLNKCSNTSKQLGFDIFESFLN